MRGDLTRLDVINGLRGFAILGVFTVHSIGSAFIPGESLLGDFLGIGWYGVNLFFMLSGFVLYLPFRYGSCFSIRKFYVKRIKRLYPLYLICGFLSVSFYSNSNPMQIEFWKELFFMISTLTLFVEEHGFVAGNGPLWSLHVEIYLSLLAFPVLNYMFKIYNPVRVTLLVFFTFTLLHELLPCIAPSVHHLNSITFLSKVVTIGQAITEFSLGMLLALIWSEKKIEKYIIFPRTTLFFTTLVSVILLMWVNKYRNHIMPYDWHLFFWPLATLSLFLFTASAVSMPVGLFRFMFTNRLIQTIGMMCFSIYVWHIPLMTAWHRITFSSKFDYAYFSITSFLGVFIFAVFSYKFIEFPHITWKEAFSPLFIKKRRDEKIYKDASVVIM